MPDWLNNTCWLTDSDKVSHLKQYPPGTRRVYSYFESRSDSSYPEVCFFGLRDLHESNSAGTVVTAATIDAAEVL
jgi:nicotinamide phosphoribosyltransferase